MSKISKISDIFDIFENIAIFYIHGWSGRLVVCGIGELTWSSWPITYFPHSSLYIFPPAIRIPHFRILPTLSQHQWKFARPSTTTSDLVSARHPDGPPFSAILLSMMRVTGTLATKYRVPAVL